MWQIPPDFMCQKHISGEHYELHKHLHSFQKKHSITGRIKPVVQIEPASMEIRHNELANYMNHNSPYTQPDISYLPIDEQKAKVDLNISYKDLSDRCPECRALLNTLSAQGYLLSWNLKQIFNIFKKKFDK
jgi:hypothetical protein